MPRGEAGATTPETEPSGGRDRRSLRRKLVAVGAGMAVGTVAVLLYDQFDEPPQTPPAAQSSPSARPTLSGMPGDLGDPWSGQAAPSTTAAPPPSPSPRPSARVQPQATRPAPPRTTQAQPSPSPTPEPCGADWRAGVSYRPGDTVRHDGKKWVARWWNHNATPGRNAEHVWIPGSLC